MPIQWRPFKDLDRPFNLPDMFEKDEWMPFVPTFRSEELNVDIYQDKDNLYIETPLTGVKPEEVEISIEDNVLIIEGKSEEKKEIKEKDYLRKEIRRGNFKRVIKLPVEVVEDKAEAESVSCILKITIPKTSKAVSKGKKIPIKIK
ncbi:MAG: hypothetical protein A3E90_01015 [Candidatus Portnoybacteria bacterium RIFCSPHIGHO2_12_FULL_40_11]|uniref:SHSP domain-containing protein n=1 Tax=Candidatus Portnoybacteria bacterium RIFCSPHIGHO2_12_FULL_40_11 TaxID=1801998 RepID=A0A1G2FJF0_9BACT|nr:MAG: hypothetical protein A3E90_01015 [Candidatus Portnoybacteria bacterium RIFCSPHIGHO2_12_FULL_40_11]